MEWVLSMLLFLLLLGDVTSMTLARERERKSTEEHLGMWMESEQGILSPGAQPRSTQNSRVLAGSRVYQPASEMSVLQKTSQGDQRAAQMATPEREMHRAPVNPKATTIEPGAKPSIS